MSDQTKLKEDAIAILKAASLLTGVPAKRIHGRFYRPENTHPRYMVWVILTQRGHELVDIGTAFDREMGTIRSGGKRHEELMEGDWEYRKDFEMLENAIRLT